MKSSIFVAVLLTLLMFLMVLSGAFIFAFQNQGQLDQQLKTLVPAATAVKIEQFATNLNLEAALETQTPAAAAFATAQAESFALDQQLVASEQTKQALNVEIDDLKGNIEALAVERGTINAALNRYEAQGPLINVISPMKEVTVNAGQIVTITIAASDINEVTEVTVHIGDQQLDTLPITKGPIVTVDANWVAAGNGIVVMSVTAVNANGINSEFTVPFNVITPTPTPTVTPTATPTTTPAS